MELELLTGKSGEVGEQCYILAGATGKATQFVSWLQPVEKLHLYGPTCPVAELL